MTKISADKKLKSFEEIKNTGISHRKIGKNHISGKTNEKSY